MIEKFKFTRCPLVKEVLLAFLYISMSISFADWEGANVSKVLVDDSSGLITTYTCKISVSATRAGSRVAVRNVKSDSGKYAVWVDGVEGQSYEWIAEATPLFSENGASVAYCVRKKNQWCWVINGEEGPFFEKELTPTSFSFSPNGKRHAYVAKLGFQHNTMVVDGEQVDAHGNGEAMIHDAAPVFSPDGKRIAYGESHRKNGSMRVNLDGSPGPWGQGLTMVRSPGFGPAGSYSESVTPGVYAFFFSADSKSFHYGQSVGNQFRKVIDGVPQPPFENFGVDFVFSPDGKEYAYMSYPEGRRALVRSQGDSIPIEVIADWTLTYSPDGKHLAFGGVREGKAAVFVDGQAAPSNVKIGFIPLGKSMSPNALTQKAVMFSPDSKRLAYAAISEQKTGHWIVDGKAGPPWDAASLTFNFSPDSRHFAYFFKGEKPHETKIVVDGVVRAIHPMVLSTVFLDDGTFEYLACDPDGKLFRYTITGY